MADTASMSPNQIILATPTFVSEDGSPVDVTGFVVKTTSADESLAVWGRFASDGQPDPEGAYGIKSLAVGVVPVTYSVINLDGSEAVLTGTVTIENEGASTGSMNFAAPIDVPA